MILITKVANAITSIAMPMMTTAVSWVVSLTPFHARKIRRNVDRRANGINPVAGFRREMHPERMRLCTVCARVDSGRPPS